MKSFKSDAQFTTLVHSMMKHKIQATLWDLISWLETGGEIQSVRDILSYIRLFSDFGDATQGRIFLNLIIGNQTLRLILPDIASRFVSRGKALGMTWLEELGSHVQALHVEEPHPGVGHDREEREHFVFDN